MKNILFFVFLLVSFANSFCAKRIMISNIQKLNEREIEIQKFKENYFKKISNDVLRYKIINSLSEQNIDNNEKINFEVLERITELDQQIVSTENLKELCEILNNLLNLKNCSKRFNEFSKKELKKLLKKNIVNFADIHGNTVLHFACQKGYENVVKFLIDNGAKIDVYASENLHFGTLKILRGRQVEEEVSTSIITHCSEYMQIYDVDLSTLIPTTLLIRDWHPIFDAYINGHNDCREIIT